MEKGQTVTFTAEITVTTPKYLIAGWLQGGEPIVEAGIERSYSIIITKPVDISVVFEKAQQIAIKGDERVETSSIDIPENTVWKVIKSDVSKKLQLKSGYQADDYGIYEWKITDKNGEAITDDHKLAAGDTVYAVTNYTKFNIDAGALKGYTGGKPKGNIILPSDITKIDENAFKECTELTGTLDLSKCVNLTLIGYNAFYKCSGLTGLILPENLTTIDINAFAECENLTGKLNLPESLKSVNDYAFNNCKKLNGELSLPETLETIGKLAFKFCNGITSVKIRSAKLKLIGEQAFVNMKPGIPFTVKTDGVKGMLENSNSNITGTQITVDSSI
ncbi:MAG: leucine-rich repeat domain-containing protein [Treponema socranskii subsp. buccale]